MMTCARDQGLHALLRTRVTLRLRMQCMICLCLWKAKDMKCFSATYSNEVLKNAKAATYQALHGESSSSSAK